MNTFMLVVRRFLHAFLLILAVLVLNFLLIHIAPGEPAEVIAGEMGGATEEMLADIRKTYGLDQPVYVQLGKYLGKALTGDLGQSFFYNAPVLDLVLDRVWATILLVVTALIFAIIVGTLLGVLASHNPKGIVSGLVTLVSVVGYSAPIFWTGMLLVVTFAWLVPVFPISG